MCIFIFHSSYACFIEFREIIFVTCPIFMCSNRNTYLLSLSVICTQAMLSVEMVFVSQSLTWSPWIIISSSLICLSIHEGYLGSCQKFYRASGEVGSCHMYIQGYITMLGFNYRECCCLISMLGWMEPSLVPRITSTTNAILIRLSLDL